MTPVQQSRRSAKVPFVSEACFVERSEDFPVDTSTKAYPFSPIYFKFQVYRTSPYTVRMARGYSKPSLASSLASMPSLRHFQ